MTACQLPLGCILDELSGACPLCDEDGVDVIAKFYQDHNAEEVTRLYRAKDEQEAAQGAAESGEAAESPEAMRALPPYQ